ncbi:MAG: agmatinase family protein [Candidatus Peregrinibacteria bacterium]
MKKTASQSRKRKIAAFDPEAPAVQNGNIFGLPFTAEESEVIVVPVPWEVTTSYGSGAENGPAAILEASAQLDLYDEDFSDVWKRGIFMEPGSSDVIRDSRKYGKMAKKIMSHFANGGTGKSAEIKSLCKKVNSACADLNEWVRTHSKKWLSAGKSVIVLGGDHSVPFGLMQALGEIHPRYSMLHLDAHADLREAYEGFEFSHASIQFNALKLPQVEKWTAVGLRDYSQKEAAMIARHRGRMTAFTDRELKRREYRGVSFEKTCREILKTLSKKVYVSFDIDVLNPALCPHTGTPVPGGLEFEQVFYLLKRIVESGRKIIGCDLCEVAPGKNDEWDANVGMRALYRLCGLVS